MSYFAKSLGKEEKIIGLFRQMMIFSQWGTEYAVTNKRVIAKTGLIARTINEMKTDAVESVGIKQGILGRIFDYGHIMISGRGNTTIVMKDVAYVLNAKRTIESALSNDTENQ